MSTDKSKLKNGNLPIYGVSHSNFDTQFQTPVLCICRKATKEAQSFLIIVANVPNVSEVN